MTNLDYYLLFALSTLTLLVHVVSSSLSFRRICDADRAKTYAALRREAERQATSDLPAAIEGPEQNEGGV